MDFIILVIQLIGAITLYFWLKVLTMTIFPLGVDEYYKKITTWIVFFLTFLYPFFLSWCFWASWHKISNNIIKSLLYAILPIIIFFIIYLLVQYRFKLFSKKPIFRKSDLNQIVEET